MDIVFAWDASEGANMPGGGQRCVLLRPSVHRLTDVLKGMVVEAVEALAIGKTTSAVAVPLVALDVDVGVGGVEVVEDTTKITTAVAEAIMVGRIATGEVGVDATTMTTVLVVGGEAGTMIGMILTAAPMGDPAHQGVMTMGRQILVEVMG